MSQLKLYSILNLWNIRIIIALFTDPDNSELEDDSQYSVFVSASTNDGNTVSSSWSNPITTLPAGVPPGKNLKSPYQFHCTIVVILLPL